MLIVYYASANCRQNYLSIIVKMRPYFQTAKTEVRELERWVSVLNSSLEYVLLIFGRKNIESAYAFPVDVIKSNPQSNWHQNITRSYPGPSMKQVHTVLWLLVWGFGNTDSKHCCQIPCVLVDQVFLTTYMPTKFKYTLLIKLLLSWVD